MICVILFVNENYRVQKNALPYQDVSY